MAYDEDGNSFTARVLPKPSLDAEDLGERRYAQGTASDLHLLRAAGAADACRRADRPTRPNRKHETTVIGFDLVWKTMQRIDADFPAPPANAAIRFTARLSVAARTADQ